MDLDKIIYDNSRKVSNIYIVVCFILLIAIILMMIFFKKNNYINYSMYTLDGKNFITIDSKAEKYFLDNNYFWVNKDKIDYKIVNTNNMDDYLILTLETSKNFTDGFSEISIKYNRINLLNFFYDVIGG